MYIINELLFIIGMIYYGMAYRVTRNGNPHLRNLNMH